MKTEAAIDFLLRHQPLPPTNEASEALLKQFNDVVRHFSYNIDRRCVPLLIGALGEGDGHGIFQTVETTLLAYPKELVVNSIKNGLASPNNSVRYWSAQFAADYRDEKLLQPLIELFSIGGIDERIAAVTAIEAMGTNQAIEALQGLLSFNLELPVKEMLLQILGN